MNLKTKSTPGFPIYPPYIVTKASDDGTFQIGDRISLNYKGDVHFLGTSQIIEAKNLEQTTKGMEYRIDTKWIDYRLERLKQTEQILLELKNS